MPRHRRGNYRIGGTAALAVLFFISAGALLAAGQVAVTTYHYDNNRTGWNRHETVLTTGTGGEQRRQASGSLEGADVAQSSADKSGDFSVDRWRAESRILHHDFVEWKCQSNHLGTIASSEYESGADLSVCVRSGVGKPNEGAV